MFRQSLAAILLSLAACKLQAKTTLPTKNIIPKNDKTKIATLKNNKTVNLHTIPAKVKITQNFHTCFKEAWNVQWQNYCVMAAIKSYKDLIPKTQQAAFKDQVKSCTAQFEDVAKLDDNDAWKVYECEMHVAEKFAR